MKVAIVGASGAVGQELLRILAERNFPLDDLVLFGSTRSAGRKYTFKGERNMEGENSLANINDDFKDVRTLHFTFGRRHGNFRGICRHHKRKARRCDDRQFQCIPHVR